MAQISVNEKSYEVENFLRCIVGDRPVHSLLNSSCYGREWGGCESPIKG